MLAPEAPQQPPTDLGDVAMGKAQPAADKSDTVALRLPTRAPHRLPPLSGRRGRRKTSVLRVMRRGSLWGGAGGGRGGNSFAPAALPGTLRRGTVLNAPLSTSSSTTTTTTTTAPAGAAGAGGATRRRGASAVDARSSRAAAARAAQAARSRRRKQRGRLDSIFTSYITPLPPRRRATSTARGMNAGAATAGAGASSAAGAGAGAGAGGSGSPSPASHSPVPNAGSLLVAQLREYQAKLDAEKAARVAAGLPESDDETSSQVSGATRSTAGAGPDAKASPPPPSRSHPRGSPVPMVDAGQRATATGDVVAPAVAGLVGQGDSEDGGRDGGDGSDKQGLVPRSPQTGEVVLDGVGVGVGVGDEACDSDLLEVQHRGSTCEQLKELLSYRVFVWITLALSALYVLHTVPCRALCPVTSSFESPRCWWVTTE